jgi:hypothetical protein
MLETQGLGGVFEIRRKIEFQVCEIPEMYPESLREE